MKNWITMKRNILLLLFVFFLPAIVLIVNSVMIGQDPKNLPMAIVNLESDCSDRFFLTSCEANLLGCYFQEALNQSKIVTLSPTPTCPRPSGTPSSGCCTALSWCRSTFLSAT